MRKSPARKAAGPLPEQHLVTVFEAVNETLREVYVGTTTHLVEVLTRLFLERPPGGVRHWSTAHKITVRCVEYSVAVHDVSEFIEAYAGSEALRSWKVIRQRSPPGPG